MYKVKNSNTIEYRSRKLWDSNFGLLYKPFEKNILSKLYFEIYDCLNNCDNSIFALHFMAIFELLINDEVFQLRYEISDKMIEEFKDILANILVNDTIMDCQQDISLIQNKITEYKTIWLCSEFPIRNDIINKSIEGLSEFVNDQCIPNSFYKDTKNFDEKQIIFKQKIANSFNEVKESIKNLKLEEYIQKVYNNKEHFETAKSRVIHNIDSFINGVDMTLFPEGNKSSPLIKEHFLSFLIDDTEIKEKYFKNFTQAMKIAFSNEVHFIYYTAKNLEDKVRKYRPQTTHKEDTLNKLWLLINKKDKDKCEKEYQAYFELYEQIIKELDAEYSYFPAIIMTLELNLSDANGISLAKNITNKTGINKTSFLKQLRFLGDLIYFKNTIDNVFINTNESMANHLGKVVYDNETINKYKKVQKFNEAFTFNKNIENRNIYLDTHDLILLKKQIAIYLKITSLRFEDIIYEVKTFSL